MGGEVAVAEPEPDLAAQSFERCHKGPGLASPAPTQLGVVLTRERVEQRVEIGRDREAEMLEIVAGVGHNRHRIGQQDAVEAERELGAADPARQRQHGAVGAHRNNTEQRKVKSSRSWPGLARPSTKQQTARWSLVDARPKAGHERYR